MSGLSIPCDDGYALRATELVPASDRGLTAIICPAIFVRQRFYAACARQLAAAGIRAITFANRGMGESLWHETRPWQHRLEHWGQRDLPAVVAWARRGRDDRLFVIGHSMGGQLVGLSDAVHQLEGLVTVASTEAWWGHWPLPTRLAILAWFGVVPVLGLRSTFPAERLRVGPTVDSALVRDWARWGRRRGYLFEAFGLRTHLADYRGRVLAYSFTDDELLGCSRAVDALHRRFARATVVRRHVDPAEHGLHRLGHFGWFRQGIGDALRAEAIEWMVGGG